MPHIYLKDFKSNISAIATAILAEAEAYALKYANDKVNEIVNELLEQCPTPEATNVLLKKLDDLKKVQLGIEQKITKVQEESEKLDKPIAVTKVSIEILSHIPLPSSIPPGIGIPVGVLNTYSNALEFLRGMVNALEDDKQAILSVIDLAQTTFAPVQVQIARIEQLLNRCTEDPNLSEEDRKKILEGFTDNTLDEQSTSLYTAANGNTYTLSIETNREDTYVTKKRRAIATDVNGVIVLKGAFSYAGSTDILIKEIKFRLDKQLP